MEECDLLCLETGTTEDVIEVLKKFIVKVSEIPKICVGRFDCQWLSFGGSDKASPFSSSAVFILYGSLFIYRSCVLHIR
jgi:hypothetical protein